MKMILVAIALFGSVAGAQQGQYIQGYYRSNGTYVQGHYRSRPDGNMMNNYSTQGNVNPYTGQPGSVSPNMMNYGSPRLRSVGY